MACLATGVSFFEAVLTSLGITVAYVGVLYLPFNVGDRDNGRIIVSRITTLSLLATFLEVYTRHRVPDVVHKLSQGTRLPGLVVGTFLTLLLYAGHLVVAPRRLLATHLWRADATRLVALRNYIAAPLLEEIVFRRQTLLLWSCQAPMWRLLFPSMMFSLAHVHHVSSLGTVTIIFHMAYTFLFAVYAGALYVNTLTVWAACAAHVVCNMLELPDFAAIAAHRRGRAIAGLYAGCIVLFAVAFAPLTTMVRPYQLATE